MPKPLRILNELAAGFSYPFRGLRMLRDRRVLMLSIAPFLISLALYAAVLVAVIALGGHLADLIVEPGPWWRDVLRALLWIGMVTVFLIVFVFTYSMLALLVAAPLFEFISARTEHLHTGEVVEEQTGLRELLIDMLRALTETVRFLVLGLMIWTMGLVLPPFTTVLAVLLGSVLVALEMMEGPMGRRRMSFAAKLAFARRHGWRMLGLGVVMSGAMLIPIVGAAAITIGVCAGTMMFCDLKADESGTTPQEPHQHGA